MQAASRHAYWLIVLCAALVSLPLWLHGPSCGHDFDFHLQSWLAANLAWHSGLAWPHWVAGANYGAGEPRFVFYPPLSWMLGALLGAVFPWGLTPAVFTGAALAGAGASFFALARRHVRDPFAAGAACVYLANPYLLFVAYERTAYGELLAAVWMPWVLLYAVRTQVPIVRLAIVVALLWLTNAPAAVMGCYLLGLCAVVTGLRARSLKPALRSFGALTLGTGVAGVYVLPAWYEQRWVEIARVVGPGMRVEDSFLFGHSGQAFHDQVLHTASVIAVGVLGFGLAALAVLVAAQWLRGRREVEAHDRVETGSLKWILVATLLAITFLLLPLSQPVWREAPELGFLQFPWRWLLVGSLGAALAAGLSAHTAAPAGRRPGRGWVMPALAATLCAGAWFAGHLAQSSFAQSCDEEDNVQAQRALLLPSASVRLTDEPDAAGFEGTDEYTPLGADNGEVQKGLPPVRLLSRVDQDEGDDSTAPNPDWGPEGKDAAHRLQDTARGVRLLRWEPEEKLLDLSPLPSHASFAVLRVMDYPAWRVRVNGRLISGRPHREDGLMTIPLERGTNRVEVTWIATPDVLAGRAVSLIALGLLAGLAMRRRWRTPLPG